ESLPSRVLLSVGLVLVAGLLLPASSWANIQEVTVSPPEPTSCDSVLFSVSGYFTDGCWHYDGYDVEMLPIRTAESPVGAVFRLRVLCHHDSAAACPLIIVPYEISHPVGPLPPGPYLLIVDEVDSGQFEVIYDHRQLSFTVGQCGPPPGCVLPGFGPDIGGCNAIVSPGAPGLLYLTLDNPMAVAGAEMVVDGFLQFRDTVCASSVRCGYGLKVTKVEPVGRADDMGLAWTFSEWKLHMMFHPLSDIDAGGLGIIEPGTGAVTRIVIEMAVDSTIWLDSTQVLPDLDFTLTLQPVAFADENAQPIPVCPTTAPITGTVCVRPAQKCDVNGDGRADVVDIVRMIQCIMCNVPEGCCTPDEIARGDCNGDGVLNVTDVVCCIRRILDSRCQWCGGPAAPEDGAERASVALSLEPEWQTRTGFSLPVSMFSASEVAGVELRIAYDPDVLSVQGVDAGEQARGKDAHFSASDGELSIMLVAADGQPLPPCAGELARVSFSLVEDASAERTVVSLLGVAGAGANGTRLEVGSTNSELEIVMPFFPSLASRPNPFLGLTDISLYLDSGRIGSLRVYDTHGRLVSRVFEGPLAAGAHSFEWNGRDDGGREVPSGVYFLKFEGGARSLSRKVVLLRR
ncbi:MAG: T9SS type A sorting domain-containing protein, partial [Candidatus Eisenbacteria bacterium]|nr:T9SS type A sorting domain-containing protein [Candidatus Eisenbacteria bacterium]